MQRKIDWTWENNGRTFMVPLIALIILVLLSPMGAITKDEFEVAMKADSIEKAEMVSYGRPIWGDELSCGSDFYSERFRGTKDGRPVVGLVCKMWFRGVTVRYR